MEYSDNYHNYKSVSWLNGISRMPQFLKIGTLTDTYKP